jgi:hypothetical protein
MSQPITPRPDPPKPEDVKAQYGFVALLAKAVPEINAILDKATRESWTGDRFSMEIANTSWWKSTPAEQRQWITQQISDPASAARALETGGNLIATMGHQLGFYGNVLSPQTAQDIWLFTKLHGFNETQTRAYMFNTLKGATDKIQDIGGDYGQVLNSMRTVAANYGYDLGPNGETELRDWAAGVMQAGQGADAASGWESKMKNFAATKYAAYADRIKAGETVKDIAEPYVQSYSKLLEQVPGQGFRDPLIEKALQGQLVDGKAITQNVWQFEQSLRQDPRWGFTQNAREDAAKTATSIGKAFGMIG